MRLPWKKKTRSWPPAPVTCPACGAKKGVIVLFGMPTSAGAKAVDEGKAVFGTCIPGATQTRQCLACKHRWATTEA